MRHGWINNALRALLVSLVLSGCGGGSDGGGGGAPGLGTVSPSSVNLYGYAGDTLSMTMNPMVNLTASVTGDISRLNNATVYVYIEAPHPIFASNGLTFDTGSNNASLNVQVISPVAPGTYQGTMTIRVCLDQGCSSQLGNSPLHVPYDVTIYPGITVSQPSIEFSHAFGTPLPEAVTVDATPLHNASAAMEGFINDWINTPFEAQASETFETVSLRPKEMRRPGTYTGRYSFLSSALFPVLGGMDTFSQQKNVNLTYTVTENPGVWAVASPATVGVTMAQGSVDTPEFILGILWQYESMGPIETPSVQYISAPPAASGNALEHDWLFRDSTLNRFFTRACTAAGPSQQCLPAGTYQATVTYPFTDGAPSLVYSITLTVTP